MAFLESQKFLVHKVEDEGHEYADYLVVLGVVTASEPTHEAHQYGVYQIEHFETFKLGRSLVGGGLPFLRESRVAAL